MEALRLTWDDPGRRIDIALAALLTLVAAVLYVSRLTTESLWRDEGATYSIMLLPAGPYLGHLVFGEPSMAAYYVVLRGWVALFGMSEAGMRSLSAVCAAASVPFVYLTGLRPGGRFVAFAAAALLVTNPFVLYFAVEARSYALALLAVAVATWLLLRATETNDRRRWVAYAVAATAATWIHFYAVFVVVAHGAWAWWMGGRTRRGGLIAAGAGVAASIPVGVAIALWGPERSWLQAPTMDGLIDTLSAVVGDTGPAVTGTSLAVAYLAAFLAVGVGAAGALWRTGAARHDARAGWVLLLFSIAGSILAGLAASLVKPIFIARSLIVAVPSLHLAMASALAMPSAPPVLRPGWLAGIALVLVLGLAGTQLLQVSPVKADWRAAVAAVAERAEDGDAILAYPVGLGWEVARYYVQRTPALEGTNLLGRPSTRSGDVPAMIADASGRDARIWVLILDGTLARPPAEFEPVADALERHGYRVEQVSDSHRVQLLLFVRS